MVPSMNMIIITNPSHPSQPLPRFLGPFFPTIFMIMTMWWESWRWISQFTWLESQLCFLSYLCNWFIFMIIMMEIVEILMMKMIKNLIKMIQTIKIWSRWGALRPRWEISPLGRQPKFLLNLRFFSAIWQSCEMSNFLHRQYLSSKFYPKNA